MSRVHAARLFTISASLIVLALVGGAMLHRKAAPPILADNVRPHGERGPCANCHQITAARRAHGLTSQTPGSAANLLRDRPTAAAPATLPAAATPSVAMTAQQTVPSRFLGPARQPAAFRPAQRMQQWAPAPSPTVARDNFAPAIVAGTPSPHGWRGECTACHTMVQPQSATPRGGQNVDRGWQPTPPLNRQPPAKPPGVPDPPEAEALGMAVRATRRQTDGLMVVEVEGMARRSGLLLGDIVRAVDGKVTTDIATFMQASRNADPGRGVVLDTVRNGEAKVVILR